MAETGQYSEKIPAGVLLLARYPLFETQDLDEAREIISRIPPHQITSYRPQVPFFSRVQHVELGAVDLTYVQSNSWLSIKAGENVKADH